MPVEWRIGYLIMLLRVLYPFKKLQNVASKVRKKNFVTLFFKPLVKTLTEFPVT